MAGPISSAAGEEDQITGEGLVLLDHDDVPNLQDRQTMLLTEHCLCAAEFSFPKVSVDNDIPLWSLFTGEYVNVNAFPEKDNFPGILPKQRTD